MKKRLAVCVIAASMAAMMVSGTAMAEEYKVGILKYMDHASLDQIEDAILAELDALSEEGEDTYVYEGYVYSGNAETATMQQQAAQLIDDDQVDIVIPIATPAVSPLTNEIEDLDEPIPVVFAAVSDPVGSELVDSLDAPGGYITGTSDALNTEAILDLMFLANPDLEKVGLLYSLSEDSSTQPIADAKAYLDEKGIEYVEATGTNNSEIMQAVESLISDGVQAIFTPTDNTVMSAELSIYETLLEAGVPHYTGADSFAVNGAFVGFGVDYELLGKETADLAVAILQGADPAETAVVTFDNGIVTVNTETAEALGIDYSVFEEVATQIVEVVTAESME
ncbi:MAG: ABC transporter substrate-binding protein [Lachnospiraceae bacterium]|nr:ABC transporter substrate-binding protein [Lachnospiraceae bacterium]